MSDSFEGKDMADTRFEDVNLAGATFRDVNLRGATFTDVCLAGATLRAADLRGLVIRDADVEGVTVNGIEIGPLIEDALDRRDPLRPRLRAGDPHDAEALSRVFDRLETVRADLIRALRTASPEAANRRSADGAWSALENLRHLVYADEFYLHRLILADDAPLSDLGLVPEHARRSAPANVGTNPSTDLGEILAAWNAVHASIRTLLSSLRRADLERPLPRGAFGGRTTVGEVLAALPEHELHHIRCAERRIGSP